MVYCGLQPFFICLLLFVKGLSPEVFGLLKVFRHNAASAEGLPGCLYTVAAPGINTMQLAFQDFCQGVFSSVAQKTLDLKTA